jgi:hypothetical protein
MDNQNNDQDNRKTLSLKNARNNKSTNNEDTMQGKYPYWYQELSRINQKRNHVLKALEHTEKKLSFSPSQPLKNNALELKQQDMKLICQTTEILLEHL